MLYLGNRQKSRWKVRIYSDEKLPFLKGAWHLTLPGLGIFKNLKAGDS